MATHIMQKLLPLLLMLMACGKEQDAKPSVLSLKEMSDLATVEYTVTKIIKANDNKTWYKPGDRKILMRCEAQIKAGIDMAGIAQNNFTIEDKKVTVQLPPPKIISINIPPEKIKVEYEEVSFLRNPFSAAERDALAAQAETNIRNSIPSLGILEQAKTTTTLFVTNFLTRLGYEEVTVRYENFSPLIKPD